MASTQTFTIKTVQNYIKVLDIWTRHSLLNKVYVTQRRALLNNDHFPLLKCLVYKGRIKHLMTGLKRNIVFWFRKTLIMLPELNIEGPG